MAESLPNLILGCRADGACDYVSPQWVEYTGAPTAELLGHGWLHAVQQQDRDAVRQQWRAAIQSGTAANLQFRLRAKSGDHRWFKCGLVPIRDKEQGGEVVRHQL